MAFSILYVVRERLGEKDEKADGATLQGEEGSKENCRRECWPGQGLVELKKGAIDALIQDLFCQPNPNPIMFSLQINLNRYLMCRRRRRRKGGADQGLRARSLRQDQDRGRNFANQGGHFILSDLQNTKTNVDRDTLLSAIEITCMDFDSCNTLNMIE